LDCGLLAHLGPAPTVTEPPTAQPDHQRALQLAWKAVGRREHTVGQLRTYLEGKRAEPEEIEAALAELTEAGVLDDARYAQRFAEDKRSLERWGSERIERELQRRGVDPELIAVALAGQGRGEEIEAAVELLSTRFPAPPSDDRERDRAWRLLVRRGYEPELAYEAVRAHGRA
jgi:regulatory protein